MAILKVARLGNPVLRMVAAPLTPREIQSPSFQKFIDDMIETMKEYDGVGLAADQVHEPLISYSGSMVYTQYRLSRSSLSIYGPKMTGIPL